jgi:O-antigen/teichoic acid export membrane protein
VTTAHSAAALALLVTGTTLNGLVTVPYALQLAYGWTRLMLYTNAIAVVLLIPLLYFAALTYGGLGAALLWVALNASYMFIAMPIMFQRLLRAEKWRWYRDDVALPIVAALAVAGALRPWIDSDWGTLPVLLYLSAALAAAALAAVLAAPLMRAEVLRPVDSRLRAWFGTASR